MKALKFLLYLVLFCALVFAAWFYRPWSEYSPAKVASLQKNENLVESFRSMASLIPYKTVRKADSVSALNFQLSPLALSYEFEGAEKTLAQFIEESTTTGLVVIKDGVVRYEDYFHDADESTQFTSWSVAKSFIATAIAMAVKKGEITSLDDKAEKYAPQFAGSDFGASSLQSLIAMSSGIKFDEDYASDTSDIRPFFFDSFILGKNPDELLTPFKQSRPAMSDFHYISPNTHVLSAVLRGIYKKPIADIISEKIWEPLGMESDATWLQHRNDEQGVALGYCCLNATTRDYARFGLFYLDAFQGKGLGSELLPNGWARAMTTPATPAHSPARDGNYSGRGYSQHFWLPAKAQNVFFASGVYGQFIWIDTARNLVIARNSSDPDWTPRYPESEAVFEAISKHYDE